VETTDRTESEWRNRNERLERWDRTGPGVHRGRLAAGTVLVNGHSTALCSDAVASHVSALL